MILVLRQESAMCFGQFPKFGGGGFLFCSVLFLWVVLLSPEKVSQ